MSTRVKRIRELLAKKDLDGILVSKPENRRYLSGFTGSAGHLMIAQDALWLFTDFRYADQATQQAPDFSVVRYSNVIGNIYSVMADTFRTHWRDKPLKIAFEGGFLVHDAVQDLKSAMPHLHWESLSLKDLRMQKDEEEVACIRKAMQIAEEAYLEVLPRIRPGISEADVALDLEIAMRRRGAQGKAFDFDFIVASGYRGAFPHGYASDKLLVSGELVTLDFGALYKGYRSDMTRTVCLGPADAKQREIYQLVLKAHKASYAAMRPGASCKDIDGIARQIITDAGYGDQFGHGLGHGIGLDLWEEPFMNTTSTAVMSENMVITVEPGVYLPGWGGIRIEDTVLITANGRESLNQTSKELLELI